MTLPARREAISGEVLEPDSAEPKPVEPTQREVLLSVALLQTMRALQQTRREILRGRVIEQRRRLQADYDSLGKWGRE